MLKQLRVGLTEHADRWLPHIEFHACEVAADVEHPPRLRGCGDQMQIESHQRVCSLSIVLMSSRGNGPTSTANDARAAPDGGRRSVSEARLRRGSSVRTTSALSIVLSIISNRSWPTGANGSPERGVEVQVKRYGAQPGNKPCLT
jgi:hypothetical protein